MTTNNRALEQNLLEEGYAPVSLDQAQAGDVIIGKRPDGMPGHAAIYVGKGMIFNNDSHSGVMQLDSAKKFSLGMHDADSRWNKNGYSEVVVYRKPQPREAVLPAQQKEAPPVAAEKEPWSSPIEEKAVPPANIPEAAPAVNSLETTPAVNRIETASPDSEKDPPRRLWKNKVIEKMLKPAIALPYGTFSTRQQPRR